MIGWEGLIGLTVSILSFGFAIFTEIRRRRLSEVFRSNNWYLYQKANNSNAHAQLALNKYKELHGKEIDPEILELLAKGDAFGQDVIKDIIRLIQINEPGFSERDFKRWAEEGKIDQSRVALFMKFAVTPSRKSFFRKFFSRLSGS